MIYGSNSWNGPGGPAQPFISGSEGGMSVSRQGITVGGHNTEGGERVEKPGRDMPFVFGPHLELPERHVYSDIMHMVDCALNDKEPAVSAEHARHVIEIIELGYKAAETGQTQDLSTTFTLRELTVGPE